MEIESTDVRVTSLHNLIKQGAWRVETPHSSKRARLYWVTKGQGRVTSHGVKRGFTQHTAIFLPPRTMYSFEFSQYPLGTRVCFPIDLTASLPDETMFLRVTNAKQQAELTQVLDQLSTELRDHGPGWFAAARSYAALTGVHIDRLAAACGTSKGILNSSQRIVQGYTSLIEEHLHQGYTVAEFAQILGITPTHLTRVCNEVCGKTASTLLNERVIAEARRLLEDTDHPIRQIAEDLGFGSAAYFTRAFGQRTGMTPSAARTTAKTQRKIMSIRAA